MLKSCTHPTFFSEKVTAEPEEEMPMETDEQEEKTENIVPKIQLEEEIVESPSKKAKLDLENDAENVEEAETKAETETETNTAGENEKNHDESFESCNELQLEDDTEVLPTMNVVEEHTEKTETNQEPSEKEDTETVDATDAANAGDKATDENQKEMEDVQLTKPKAENRRQTRTKAKVEESPLAKEDQGSKNRRLTRTKAKVEEEKPIENRRLTRTKAKVEENTAPVVPENRRLTRTKAKVIFFLSLIQDNLCRCLNNKFLIPAFYTSR